MATSITATQVTLELERLDRHRRLGPRRLSAFPQRWYDTSRDRRRGQLHRHQPDRRNGLYVYRASVRRRGNVQGLPAVSVTTPILARYDPADDAWSIDRECAGERVGAPELDCIDGCIQVFNATRSSATA